MKLAAPPRPQRCAVYTRKSTEYNLDLAFNSLDAQREACEAYIASQRHEGWRLLPDRYDDGGLSGATLDRPALSRLLAEVRVGRIDVIVVYKVDRLTRSLSDFAKLVELFDGNGVSFVSVTQSFNTTSSMGRLTLNVLLSFAQFEREVIGERVRDKIAASKRKGLWTGGGVPLGYRVVDKQLVPDPDEAGDVRAIFERYLALGSIGALSDDLADAGIRPRSVRREPGETSVRPRFSVGALGYLLSNRVYVGEVPHKGVFHPGVHEPIVPRDLFEAVQSRLAANAVDRQRRGRASPHLLMGLLFDDRGHAMSPSHARKTGVSFRYYVSQAVLQRRKADAGSVTRVSAPDIEAVVMAAIRPEGDPAHETDRVVERQFAIAKIDRVVVTTGEVVVTLKDDGHEDQEFDPRASHPTVIRIPWSPPPFTRRKGVRHTPRATPTDPAGPHDLACGGPSPRPSRS